MSLRNKKAGLFFGSFNPIHIGHLIIANHMVEFSDLQEVWFIISPQNPFKKKHTLLNNHHRLMLVKTAIEDNPKLNVSDIEFGLPTPSYTVNTLAHLYEKYPQKEFALIMGSDNLVNLHKWKNYEEILKHHEIYVYPRPNTPVTKFDKHKKIRKIDAPLIEISSSFIRKSIKEKKNIRYMLPEKVYQYIKEMHFYE